MRVFRRPLTFSLKNITSSSYTHIPKPEHQDAIVTIHARFGPITDRLKPTPQRTPVTGCPQCRQHTLPGSAAVPTLAGNGADQPAAPAPRRCRIKGASIADRPSPRCHLRAGHLNDDCMVVSAGTKIILVRRLRGQNWQGSSAVASENGTFSNVTKPNGRPHLWTNIVCSSLTCILGDRNNHRLPGRITSPAARPQ